MSTAASTASLRGMVSSPPQAAQEYYRRISAGYERGLTTAMQAGQIRDGDVEGLAYALMGIGHFLALRWLIWPVESVDNSAAPDTSVGHADVTAQPSERIPEAVFTTVMQFIARGLGGTSQAREQAVASAPESTENR
jgi:hypothetical protein